MHLDDLKPYTKIRRGGMTYKLHYLRAAINTFPRAFFSGTYYFLKGWDTEIKLAMMPQGKGIDE